MSIANAITISRIAFATMLIIVKPFTHAFWLFYVLGGLSDMIDGFVARRLKCESDFGARLDSIADAVFLFAAAIAVVRVLFIPAWLSVFIALALFLRLAAYGACLMKYRKLVSIHTYGNKAAGAILFMSPLSVCLIGLTATGIISSAAAILSAAEELAIIIMSKKPEHLVNMKGLCDEAIRNVP